MRAVYAHQPNRTCLQGVREFGDFEGWLKFFLRGIAIVATEAAALARKIVALRVEQRGSIQETFGRTASDGLRLLDELFSHPYVTVAAVQRLLGRSVPAASRLVNRMVETGILTETTGRRRDRVFVHRRYLELFE